MKLKNSRSNDRHCLQSLLHSIYDSTAFRSVCFSIDLRTTRSARVWPFRLPSTMTTLYFWTAADVRHFRSFVIDGLGCFI
jgi:hypothetical protein